MRTAEAHYPPRRSEGAHRRRQPAAVHQGCAPRARAARGGDRRGLRAHGTALRPRAVAGVLRGARARSARPFARRTLCRPCADAARATGRASSRNSRTWRSSSATPTPPWPARRRQRRQASPWRTSRPGCAAVTCRCRRSATASRSTALADLLLCPDERSRELLVGEGVSGRIEVVGDVMADASRLFAPLARSERVRVEHEPGTYVVATIHREANVAQPRLGRLVEGLNRLEETVVFPAHPRTRAALDARGPDARAARRAPRPDRLPRARRARVAGASAPDRLRRPSEGGVLVRRAVRDHAALDGVGRHGRGRRKCARRRRPGRARRGRCRRQNAGRAPRALRRRIRLASGSRRRSVGRIVRR